MAKLTKTRPPSSEAGDTLTPMVPADKLLTLASSIGRAWDFATREDVQKVARDIWQRMNEDRHASYTDNNATIVSKALHRMNAGRPPRIALVGMTSAGKSSLVNALFGTSIAEVRRTPDTTNCVLEVRFPSGLIIYDTPGVFGKEAYENITRAFLGLDQDPTLEQVHAIPFVDGTKKRQLLPSADLLKRAPPPDVVLFVLDGDRTMSRHDKAELKTFYDQLATAYPSRLVATATKDDDQGLRKTSTSAEEREQSLALCRFVAGGTVLPVSAFTGLGLGELVVAIFQALPESISLSKVQESLVHERRLGRLAFVISEASGTIAEMAFLKGNQKEAVQVASLYLFASICKHYEVDEAMWNKLNGNAIAIGEASGKAGERVTTKLRTPSSFWESIRSWFSNDFLKIEVREYEEIGALGIGMILPGVYALLHELSESPTSKLTDGTVALRFASRARNVGVAIQKNDRPSVLGMVRDELLSLLGTQL